MHPCSHRTLILLPARKNILRCRHCHLTIKADELCGGHCPECFDVNGRKHYDFEEVADMDAAAARYRCEDCGAIIESGYC